MLKDTIANQSELDFGEEAYKEIHKQAHLKETWRQHLLVICNMLESSTGNWETSNAPTRPTVTPIANIIIHRTASYFLAFCWHIKNIYKNIWYQISQTENM